MFLFYVCGATFVAVQVRSLHEPIIDMHVLLILDLK